MKCIVIITIFFSKCQLRIVFAMDNNNCFISLILNQSVNSCPWIEHTFRINVFLLYCFMWSVYLVAYIKLRYWWIYLLKVICHWVFGHWLMYIFILRLILSSTIEYYKYILEYVMFLGLHYKITYWFIGLVPLKNLGSVSPLDNIPIINFTNQCLIQKQLVWLVYLWLTCATFRQFIDWHLK